MNIASGLIPVSAVASARKLDHQQQLSGLIGIIYDAAIDPSLWRTAIERAAAGQSPKLNRARTGSSTLGRGEAPPMPVEFCTPTRNLPANSVVVVSSKRASARSAGGIGSE